MYKTVETICFHKSVFFVTAFEFLGCNPPTVGGVRKPHSRDTAGADTGEGYVQVTH